jgi:hypothetical protein
MPLERVVEILGLGVIGLGFYLAYFAYRLLKTEQGRPRSRPTILKAINKYLRFALILCLIAFASEIIRVFWPSDVEENKSLKKSNVELQGKLNSYISPLELGSFLEISFDKNSDKEQFKLKINELLKQAEELEQCKSHYAFNLFKIEAKMPDYGNSIDTRINIRRKERKEVYEIIQIILRGINFYRRPIDGDQQSTYEAVKGFQEAINEREGSVYFNPDNFGVFGNRTLEAIRIEYRRQGG